MNKQIISFTIEPELDQYLRRMAQKDHVSISQYLRNLLWTGYYIQTHIDSEKQEKEN